MDSGCSFQPRGEQGLIRLPLWMEVTDGMSGGDMLGGLRECMLGSGSRVWKIGRIKKAVIGRETFELKLPLQDAPSTYLW